MHLLNLYCSSHVPNVSNNNRLSIFCLQELGVPYVVMFGGTDVNECVKEAAKKDVMSLVVAGARCLVAFQTATRDTVLQIWVSGVTSRRVTFAGKLVALAQGTFTLTFGGREGGGGSNGMTRQCKKLGRKGKWVTYRHPPSRRVNFSGIICLSFRMFNDLNDSRFM